MEETTSPLPKDEVIRMLSFPEVIIDVTGGRKATRLEWRDADTYIFIKDDILQLRKSQDDPEVTHSLIVSMGDLVGTDWILV